MAQVMYESPKKASGTPRRSDWIDEGDRARRSVLEGKGWRIVGTRHEPAQDALTLAEVKPLPEPDAAELTAEYALLDGVEGLTAAQRDALVAAGYDTPEKLDAATDAELTAVEGVGMGTVRNVRKARRPAEGV